MAFNEFRYWFAETGELTNSVFNQYVEQGKLYRHREKENVKYLYLGEHTSSPQNGAIPYRERQPSHMVPHIRHNWFYTFPRRLAQNDRTQLINQGNLYRKNDGSECCHGGKHFFRREAYSDFATTYEGGQWDDMDFTNLTRVLA